jgi:hypothetical protein
MAIPFSECAFARRIGRPALAGLATTECSRRVVGSGAMGFAPGDGPIRRLGNRAEKHTIGLLLPVFDFLFSKMGRATTDYADNTDKGDGKSKSVTAAV